MSSLHVRTPDASLLIAEDGMMSNPKTWRMADMDTVDMVHYTTRRPLFAGRLRLNSGSFLLRNNDWGKEAWISMNPPCKKTWKS